MHRALAQLPAGVSADGIADAVVAAAVDFSGDVLHDDFLTLVVRTPNANPQRSPAVGCR